MTAPSALIVVGGGAEVAPRDRDILDAKLLAALPRAQHVLAIGGADHALGREYRRLHPGASWRSVEADARRIAPRGKRFDLIVVGDTDALQRLDEATALATSDASLVASLGNAATRTTLERIVEGDCTDLVFGGSPASIYKRLMDAGWMPTLVGQHAAAPPGAAFAAATHAMADALGVPRATADTMLGVERLIIESRRTFADTPPASPSGASFSVVVPTTRERQLRLNVERSPGLREVCARIVSYRGARNPAEALEQSLPQCDTDWVLLCHQDVYFPRGFGLRLNAMLAGIPAAERAQTLLGFIGIGADADAQTMRPAGFVIDRLHRADHTATNAAVSIDELAIVLARDSLHRIDPRIGWHLWATELCLASICTHKVLPRIVRLPLFHNSLNDYSLPPSFHTSAAYLAAKYPQFGPIPTLCGTIAPAASQPAEPRARVDAARALHLEDSETAIARCLACGDDEGALALAICGVQQTYRREGFAHQALYTPGLDKLLARAADHLAKQCSVAAAAAPAAGTLIIATELYDLGGHSRVLHDVANEVESPTVVLTDLFKTYRNEPAQLASLRARLAPIRVLVLDDAPLAVKCRQLRELTAVLNPEQVLYFSHHQDPIPFVATLALETPRKVFFHHGDHNACLGCTLPGLTHVDFTASLRETCTLHLDRGTLRLPLYVTDLGAKDFAEFRDGHFSVVTSGHPAKFARDGAVALQAIALAALRAIGGRFFHIGPLADDWCAEVRAHLAAHDIEASRFVPLGSVPSLWQQLAALDAAFYIGSAPVSGGRAAIEAQGCGYPVLPFRGFAEGSLLADFSSYAEPAVGWSTPDELEQRLRSLAPHHAELSASARRFYEQGFSRHSFRQALDAALARA